MKKLLIDKYTFYYEKTMIYFYDQRYHNLLFIKRINDDSANINEYDDPQIIINFADDGIEFHPNWNIKIKNISEFEYVLIPE
ncbi:hypothetical protein DY124_05590 [Apilactobacillus micheneri]|uniref:hypothetical protein n=1 Tax=Apilactobacillus micheneri TaxID=1899430 RepID=UPI001127CA46|nr:hypothetical protein [Apilactobacillus micheneri]TPR43357.1 hypothetical protein DY124_05590 [Apilactobacillus micheneri]TPR47451.1 hypothetical protein DY125_05590 [Apilactobacillus micheneri]